MTYAKDTQVSTEKTRAELDKLLSSHGASQRMIGVDDEMGLAVAGFTIAGRQVRVRVPLPTSADVEKAFRNVRGSYSWNAERKRAWFQKELDQRGRSRWRALLLLVKAKLEAVELGISTVEREFLADISLPNGKSVHQQLADDLARAYQDGTMPRLLGTGG